MTDLEAINCTDKHLKTVEGLPLVFAILSLVGIAVWWWLWFLACAMAVDALVVQGRRWRCRQEKNTALMYFSLCFCVLSGICSLGGWIAMIYHSSIFGSFDNQTIFVFSIAGPVVYCCWIAHYVLVLVNLRAMISWMRNALGKA